VQILRSVPDDTFLGGHVFRTVPNVLIPQTDLPVCLICGLDYAAHSQMWLCY